VSTFKCSHRGCFSAVCRTCLFPCDFVGTHFSPTNVFITLLSLCSAQPPPPALSQKKRAGGFFPYKLRHIPRTPTSATAFLQPRAADSVCLRVRCYQQHALTRPYTRPPTHTTPMHTKTLDSNHTPEPHEQPVTGALPGFVSAATKDRATLHIHLSHSINTPQTPNPHTPWQSIHKSLGRRYRCIDNMVSVALTMQISCSLKALGIVAP